MLTSTLLAAYLLAPQGPVVINELAYDDPNPDDMQYVELYNRTAVPLDISNWRLDHNTIAGLAGSIAIPGGTMLNAGDYYVIGDAGVPNVDLTLTYVFDDGMATYELWDNNGRLVDAVVTERNKVAFAPGAGVLEGEGLWANSLYYNTFNGLTWARKEDGLDTNNNGDDFTNYPASPGATNNYPVGNFISNFDALVVGTDVAGMAGTFVHPRVIDPTVADANNPAAIVASPQGGNAMIAWDASGGGNSAYLLSGPTLNKVFQAFVYVQSITLPAGEVEGWSIGFGSTGNLYNNPSPSGVFPGFTANGNTGISWTYEANSSGANLYLIDHNDGGWGGGANTAPTILATIPIVAGSNDGWQIMSIAVSGGGTAVTANYAGTIYNAVVAPQKSSFYIGYREGVAGVPATVRPPTLDNLQICQTPASQSSVGTGTLLSSALNMGISTTGQAIVGSSFDVDGSNLAAGSLMATILGLPNAAPYSLSIIGGPADAIVRITPNVVMPGVATAAGTSKWTLAIPALPVLCGGPVSFQILDNDPGLAVPFKWGLSARLDVVMGL